MMLMVVDVGQAAQFTAGVGLDIALAERLFCRWRC